MQPMNPMLQLSSDSNAPDRGFESFVLKLSNGKCFFNQRYLIVRNGMISYYRAKPFDGKK